MTDSSLKETFKDLSEGDTVHIEYSLEKVEWTVWSITNKDGVRRVCFDKPWNPCLTIKKDRVCLERQAKKEPRGWTEYITVDSLTIV